uniref:Uncharacterized protein n=1 Tax=Hanusia phi TaxID=3032 RepID=A0A7S0EYU1_9CRYP|mmetsp:Transcript_34549/g.77907  ORF Transcript_34549/g.77907 Transcript_34549/m.77907 type:complete len:101 (+) Transcript_34549:45-347(+)
MSTSHFVLALQPVKERMKRRALWFVFSTALASQPSFVLLPLTSMEITPYCFMLQPDLPVTAKKAACWHKWSIAGIPYGVPAILAGPFLIIASSGNKMMSG